MQSDQKQANELAATLIGQNQYMHLATCEDNTPWVAPTAFWINPSSEHKDDSKGGPLKFFFVSSATCKHVEHIKKNPMVAVGICDTSAPFMTGSGVQFNATAKVLKWEEGAAAKGIAGIVSRFPNENPEDCVARHLKMFESWVVVECVPETLYVSIHNHRKEVQLTRAEITLSSFSNAKTPEDDKAAGPHFWTGEKYTFAK